MLALLVARCLQVSALYYSVLPGVAKYERLNADRGIELFSIIEIIFEM
jgi:hypothetical protein